MIPLIKVALAAALVFAASPAAIAQQSLQEALPEVTGECAALAASESVDAGCAAALETALNSADLKEQVLAAARAGDKRAMAALLLEAGLETEQLQGAQLQFRRARGVGGAEARITIEVRCCPLTIIIRF